MESNTGRRYTDLQQGAVFEVWAYKADRSAERTAAFVATDPLCIELEVTGVTGKTIRTWSRDLGWEDKANRALFAGAHEKRFRTQVALILAAPESAEFVRKLVNLDESLKTDRVVVSVDKSSGEVFEHVVHEYDVKLLQLRLQAAQLNLDRTGFSPVGTREIGAVDAPPELHTDLLKAIGEITDEDALRRIAAQIQQEQGIGIAAGSPDRSGSVRR